jgi:hypothetical protein
LLAGRLRQGQGELAPPPEARHLGFQNVAPQANGVRSGLDRKLAKLATILMPPRVLAQQVQNGDKSRLSKNPGPRRRQVGELIEGVAAPEFSGFQALFGC